MIENLVVGQKYTLQLSNFSNVTGIFIGYEGDCPKFDFGIIEWFNIKACYIAFDKNIKSSLELLIEEIQ